MAAPIDPPYWLDLHRKIVSVGWGVGAIVLALEFEYSKNALHPAIIMRNLPVVGTVNLFDTDIYNSKGPDSPPVSNPLFTSAMLKFLRIWNRPPFKTGPNADHVCNGRSLIFMCPRNLIIQPVPPVNPPISSFSFNITIPASNAVQTIGGTTYYVIDDAGFGFTLEDLHGGIERVTVLGVFDNLSDATASKALYPEMIVTILSEESTIFVPDSFSWKVRCSTYKKKLSFPSDAVAKPTWNSATDPALVALAETSAAGTALPSYLVTFTVDKNGGIEMVRDPH